MRLIKNNYYKPNITKEWVHNNPFLRYSGLYSTNEENAYTYKFPVYKSKGSTLLECELILFEKSGNATVNVYDYNTKIKYPTFYNNTYGKNIVVNTINKNISSEFKKFGIVKNKIKVKKGK